MTDAIFGGYGREQLDLQYNLRAHVPDFQRFFDAYPADSAAARDRLDGRLDLAYGPTPRQRIDLFPAAAEGAPLLVFIHGGYWQRFAKEDWSFIAPAFVEAGISVALVGYDLCPTVTMDALVQEVRDGVMWLHDHAAAHGADPNRLFVAGHSAGGHLTAMMMSTDWTRWGRPADLVKGGCAVSGLFDLEPVRLTFLNDVLGLDAAMARRNSPIQQLPRQAGPLLLAVGDGETDEFRRQQADYLAAWRDAGLTGRAIDMPGYHHFDVVQALGRPGTPLFDAVRAMVAGDA